MTKDDITKLPTPETEANERICVDCGQNIRSCVRPSNSASLRRL